MKQPIISELSRKRKLKLLLRYLEPGAKILEVGAGSGWFSQQLRNNGYEVKTLDLFPPADYVGDINSWNKIDIPAHSFDAVVALEVIEHIDCLSSLKSLCKHGGLIMLSSPHPQWDWMMKILEALNLNQKRTSDHINLTDFNKIELKALLLKRSMFFHQIAIFKND